MELLTSALVAAVVGGICSLIVTWMNTATSASIAADKNEADEALATKRFEYEKQLAEQKLKFEQQQILFKRRFDLAEVLLSETYQFERIMAYVRSPGSFTNEGNTRPATAPESEDIKQSRDGFFVPIERMQKESEFISKMTARRFTARAFFGSEMDKAFQNFHMAQQTILMASQILIRRAGDSYKNQQVLDHENEMITILWNLSNRDGTPNEVKQLMDEGVEIVERLTRPILDLSQEPSQQAELGVK